MANSFDIDVKPEISGVAADIAANFVQILSNASALATIQTTALPDLKTQNTNIKSAIDAIADPQLPDILTAIVDNETKIDAIQTDQFFSITVSDIIITEANTERETISSSYEKVKEILISLTGEYRITFDVRGSTTATSHRGTIYKNGVAFGTPQEPESVTYVETSEDLFLIAGDLLQLYIMSPAGAPTTYIRNFKVRGTITSLTSTVITD